MPCFRLFYFYKYCCGRTAVRYRENAKQEKLCLYPAVAGFIEKRDVCGRRAPRNRRQLQGNASLKDTKATAGLL